MPPLSFSAEALVEAAYRALLRRSPEAGGAAHYAAQLLAGRPPEQVIAEISASGEARALRRREAAELVPSQPLPDLRAAHLARYRTTAAGHVLLDATDPVTYAWIEGQILRHGYYDRPGVWGMEPDLDKQVTAATAAALAGEGGRVLEIGCFNGPVLGLLRARGLDVVGLDLSHLAFVLAPAAVRDALVWGDLLTAPLRGPFDGIVAMDVFEHLNPTRLPEYARRAAELLATQGRLLLNSPMFGADARFGTVFEQYVPEWRAAGDACFWPELHCDDAGWPVHGHLVWGSPARWEALFADAGLVRDATTELALLDRLRGFHERVFARRSLFVLMRAGSAPRADLPAALLPALDAVLRPAGL